MSRNKVYKTQIAAVVPYHEADVERWHLFRESNESAIMPFRKKIKNENGTVDFETEDDESYISRKRDFINWLESVKSNGSYPECNRRFNKICRFLEDIYNKNVSIINRRLNPMMDENSPVWKTSTSKMVTYEYTKKDIKRGNS